jgi:hypothetical protein
LACVVYLKENEMTNRNEPTEKEIDAQLRKLLEKAYDAGYETAMQRFNGSRGEDGVRRIVVGKWGLLAFLIIVFGSVFSLGVYMGRMYAS